ncbi:hypothetical protein Q0F98_40090 [Paenibacillus amylolyticus]|nr:hypothetical protein Q0F98_40090 [Paenibacillus amylolyticus]
MINQPYQPTTQTLGQQANSVLGQQANSQVQGTSYKIGNGMPAMSPTPGMVSPSSTSVPPLCIQWKPNDTNGCSDYNNGSTV